MASKSADLKMAPLPFRGRKVDSQQRRLVLLEGSASIRTAPLGNHGAVGRRKARADCYESALRIQEISPQGVLIGLNASNLRPIAIVPATPSTLDGLCGPEQRNGVGFFSEERERRSATVDCFRLVVVVLVLQTRSREELRQSAYALACACAAFLLTCRRRILTRVCTRFERNTFERNTLYAIPRSSSAYVPSARQAGPHAHPL